MTQHTPLALHTDDLTCTYTQMSQGGDLLENTQASASVHEALGDVRAIIERLLGKVEREVIVSGGMSLGMWDGLNGKSP